MILNENFDKLQNSYLFKRIGEKVANYKTQNPEADIVRLGIGDVTLPLAKPVIQAMEKAVAEMGVAETFRGYEDGNGYDFLKEKIVRYYGTKRVKLDISEVFMSDGAKSDVGNVLDIFGQVTALIPDPVYPAYVDTNVMKGNKVAYFAGSAENGFLPLPTDELNGDIIYLCSPNNPTGSVYTKEQLKAWVDFANAKGAIILFDAAYEAFVEGDELPTSIYQIDGAERCAIEFCSLSKTAGFTGTRCGWTIVPKACGEGLLNARWARRQSTKFNGVPYIVQRGAEAVFAEDGGLCDEVKANIAYYKENAKIIMAALDKLGISYVGGKYSPYIWLKTPDALSWEYFDTLLEEYNIVGTPGEGFGSAGEGYFRLTAFGSRENTIKAMDRLTNK